MCFVLLVISGTPFVASGAARPLKVVVVVVALKKRRFRPRHLDLIFFRP